LVVSKTNALFMDEVERLVDQMRNIGVSDDEIANLVEIESDILGNLRAALKAREASNG